MPRSTQPLRDAIAEYDRTQPERDSARFFKVSPGVIAKVIDKSYTPKTP